MSPAEIMIVMAVAVLIFGKRLPEVARTAGKTLSEFRKAFQGIQDQITGAATGQAPTPVRTVYQDDAEDGEEATAPRFEPPPRVAAPPAGQTASTP